MTWPSSIGLKRLCMKWHFPLGSPPAHIFVMLQRVRLAPLCPICSICAYRREGTQHRRLALELFSTATQVFLGLVLGVSNGKPHDILHWFPLHSHWRLETRSSGTVVRSRMATLQLRTPNTHRKPLQDCRSGVSGLLHGIRPLQDCRFGFSLSPAQHRGL